jgi:polyphosphate kinase
MNFPDLQRSDLLYPKEKSLNIKDFKIESNLLDQMLSKDFLMYTPYHSFSYLVSILRQSAIDPSVKSIKITLYRLSEKSNVISSLINAAKNGKKVLVQIELQARFDEENNIKVSQQLKAAGVDLIFGVKGLKVHSKICLIERFKGNKKRYYGFISTGNFNESTAKIYTDLTLFTSNEEILNEVSDVFKFFTANYKKYNFKNIFVSPVNTESRIKKLIQNEILNAKSGKSAWIKIKINNLTSYSLIKSLYDASRSGVKIKMIVRGICCLVPGLKNMSSNIEVISIVDRFLEHTRLMIFNNNENNKVFISSADWMTRNLDNRVEVTCPILQDDLKKEINDIFEIYWKDNLKSSLVNCANPLSLSDSKNSFRSQEMIYQYYLNKIEKN